MNKTTHTAQAPAPGRSTVTRISATRRSASSRPEVIHARDARRRLRDRGERFAHLKRMYD